MVWIQEKSTALHMKMASGFVLVWWILQPVLAMNMNP